MTRPLPLEGVRVLDFGHTVMGPTAGLVLADLGAEVIKIEPAPLGDQTRRLKGFGAGYFGFLNRNKRSIVLDLKREEGRAVAHDLVRTADVIVENFAPGTMDRLGLSEATVQALNPRLIYASLKGFLSGPYERRLALDEVVQMMTGLAYMTGPPGRPLRAGASVVDIAGGLFAVIGILAALRERDRGAEGGLVETALFESCVFLMGQHLCYAARTEGPVPPMPARVSAWAVYEPFTLSDGTEMFIGVTTDQHWRRFCEAAGRPDLGDDPELATNNQRIDARPRLIPAIAGIFAALDEPDAAALCERAGIPYAPIRRPEDLFHDPHLHATGGLAPTRLPDGVEAPLPRLPLRLSGEAPPLRSHPPEVGRDTVSVLRELGRGDDEIERLLAAGVAVAAAAP